MFQFINSPIPREYLYYGFWTIAVLAALAEGGMITYFLWKLASR